MLDVRRLCVLREVALSKSVTGAAEALNYTPSAVSQQIAALEREAGLKLLRREGRGIVLTPAAEDLVEHTHRVVARLEVAEAELAGRARGLDGRIRLAAFPTAMTHLLPPVLASLRRSAPGVAVLTEDAEPETALPGLTHGRHDLVVSYEYDLLPAVRSPGLHRVEICRDPLLLVGADSRGPVALADLERADWLLPPGGSPLGQLVRRACEAAGFAPRAVATSGDLGALVALATSGAGVTLVPGLALGDDPPAGTCPLDPPLSRRIFAVVRAGAQDHPLLRLALDSFSSADA